MSANQSIEVLVNALRTRVETTTTELIFRELSFDPQRSIFSAVMIVRMEGRDRGYIWVDGQNDMVCCHSAAVSAGPLSSSGRKSFSCADGELEAQLRAAISVILLN